MMLRVPLEKLFPQILVVALDPSGSVFAHWVAGGWNIKVPHVYQEEFSSIRTELLHMLPVHYPSEEEGRDIPAWDMFSVRNAYYKLNNGGIRCKFATVIWNAKVQLKIRAFLWLVVKKGYPHLG